MKKITREKNAPTSRPITPTPTLDELIEEITVDADGEQEQLWAFRQAFEDNISLPVEGSVVGEPLIVVKFDYAGNQRRGLTAKCRRLNGCEYVVAAADVMTTRGSGASRYLAAYRKWMGLPAYPRASGSRQAKGRSSSDRGVVDTAGPVELAVLSVTQKAALCRVLGSGVEITLRAAPPGYMVPGEIVVVQPFKHWTYAGNPYLSAKVESTRLDVGALRLAPLKLEARGTWDPTEQYWGEEGEPIDEWVKPVIAKGRRPQFEMEHVLPGMDPDDSDPGSDPIGQAVDHDQAGDRQGAHRILMDLCRADLRCLDAHAHLGNLTFDEEPHDAIRHYEAGFRIGELSLSNDFNGVLSWGWIDNRPFLRCMQGFALCLWRLRRFDEARDLLERMLWLNPSDNQGVRFLVDDVRAKVDWEDSRNR
jgi:hypothetical protein